MNSPKRTRPAALLLGGLALLIIGGPAAQADDGVEGVTAVASKVSADYVRVKQSDGRFQPEYYAFGEGGVWGGELGDPTIDKLRFKDVARVIARPLASRSYLPASDPGKTRLLIMVYWGTTAVPGNPSNSAAYDEFGAISSKLAAGAASVSTAGHHGFTSLSSGNSKLGGGSDADIAEYSSALTMLNMVNQMHARTDFKNALMLGYDSPGLIGTEKGLYVRGTAFGVERNDLVSEIEENRYFVVLMAYDFQVLWKEKKHRLLWETRFSISERSNQFDRALPVMARYASQFFGEASNGLVRTRVPRGEVEVKEPTLIEVVPDPGK